jgi:hypothetical protein
MADFKIHAMQFFLLLSCEKKNNHVNELNAKNESFVFHFSSRREPLRKQREKSLFINYKEAP